MMQQLFNVGKVVNTHGIRGELKVVPQTDFPDLRFRKGSELLLFDPESQRTVPVTVEVARDQKKMFIVKFKQFDEINQVERYKGWLLKVSEEHRGGELEEDEFYYHEIVGCKVVTEEEELLGTVSEILSPGANDVWVVQPAKGKPILIPYIEDVVLSVDVDNRTIVVRLMEGLI